MQQMRPTTKPSLNDDEGYCQPFMTTYHPRKGGTFKINIHDALLSPDQLIWAVQALDAATEDDMVEISLQSPGGALDAADYFIHAMRKAEAHIHIIATGNVSSAASLILLNADSFELSEGFSSLIHCGSLGTGRVALNEYNARTVFDGKFMERILRSHYEGFLNSEDLDNLLKGQDLWLDEAGWMERYNRRNEYFKAKEEAANKPPKKPRKARQPKVETTLL
jgi:ATP-dependent protease ClpP protease subunit